MISNADADCVTKKNLFSNENILNVTDEDYSVNKHGTINGDVPSFVHEDQKLEGPRMQQTFSGDNLNKSIERNFEHDTQLMNKRPVTQLKYDRLNLTS